MSGMTNVIMALRARRGVPPVPPAAAIPAIIALGTAGANRLMYSHDGGLTWTPVNVGAKSWNGLAFEPTLGSGQGRFVAVAGDNSTASNTMYSDDAGVSWTNATFPVNFAASGVIRVPSVGLFVSGGAISGSLVVMTSADGITWVQQPMTSGGIAAPIVRSETIGLYGYPLGSAVRRAALVSAGTWSAAACPTSNPNFRWHVIDSLGRIYLSDSTGNVYYTTNLTSFTNLGASLQSQYLQFAYAPSLGSGSGRLLACAPGGTSTNRIMYSDDLGENWTGSTGYTISRVWNATPRWIESLGLFIAIADGSSGASEVAISPDGATFTTISLPSVPTNVWRDICVGEGL